MPPAEHREAHLADLLHVAHQAVGDAARCAARHAGGGQQLAPRRDAVGRPVAGQHHHVVRLQVVDQCDLHLVGVFAFAVFVHRHVQAGARAADQLQRVVERAHEGLHRLLHQAEAVEHVGQHRGVQRPQVVGVMSVMTWRARGVGESTVARGARPRQKWSCTFRAPLQGPRMAPVIDVHTHMLTHDYVACSSSTAARPTR